MRIRALWLGLVIASAACGAKAAEVEMPATGVPPLQPPTPPARLIVPAPERPTLPEVPAATAPAPAANARSRDTTPPARATPPPAATTDPTPPAVLSTRVNTADFEKRIREQLGKAEADLANVNRQSLGPDARAQYDAARGFVRQCQAALKVRNLVFAGQLADKAATMAALLRRIGG
jgi:hypothetical protein